MPSLVLTPWKAAFMDHVRAAKRSILLVSPFMKFNIVSAIHREVAESDVSVRTITRCKIIDFAAGASDLDAVYALSGLDRIDARLQLRIDNRLHAKVFVFDDEVAFIGSSNITFSGLQRNYEAVVQTDDTAFVRKLLVECERYWESAAPVTQQMVSAALEQLRAVVRTRSVLPDREEHYFVLPEAVDVVAEPTKEAFDPDLTDAAAQEMPAEPAYESAPRITGQEESDGMGLQEKLDGFFATIQSRFGIDLEGSDLGTSAAAFIADAGSYQAAFDDARPLALPTSAISPAAFTALGMLGHEVWNLGLATISVKSGLLRSVGHAGASLFRAAASGRNLLTTLWDQNLLGSPWALPGASVSRLAKHDAAYRLFGAMAVHNGIPIVVDIVEEFFNPTDLLGDDLVNLVDAKDKKTLLQEAVQARSRNLSYGDYEHVGSAHDPIWRCVVKIGGAPPIGGEGLKKAGAEAAAAEAALQWMWAHREWREILIDLRQRAADAIRKNAPWKIAPNIQNSTVISEVCAQFRADSGLDLPDTVVFPAFVDRKVRRAMGLDFDNQALGFLGSAVLNAAVAMTAFRRQEFNVAAGMRRVYADIYKLAPLDGAWALIPVDRDNSAAMRATIIQALIGGAAVRLGRKSALELSDRLISTMFVDEHEEAKVDDNRSGFKVLETHPEGYSKGGNFTESLQRLTQSFGTDLPAYSYVTSGSGHAPVFRAIVRWGTWSASAQAGSKREARDQAAFALLTKLRDAHTREELEEVRKLKATGEAAEVEE